MFTLLIGKSNSLANSFLFLFFFFSFLLLLKARKAQRDFRLRCPQGHPF